MKRPGLLRSDPAKVRAWQRRTRKALPAYSARQLKFRTEYAKARDVVRERAGYRCEARLLGCTHFGTEVHHVAGRVGPDVNAPEQLLSLCGTCHRAIHANPKRSYDAGFMASRLAKSSPAGSRAAATARAFPPLGLPAGANLEQEARGA
jgi:hypothetical protein